MDKKILVVVDGSIHSTHAVTYAARISSVVRGLTYTLFHVQPTVSQFLQDEAETDLKARNNLSKVIQKNNEYAHSILEKHKARMVEMGIEEKRVEIVTQQKMMGICKDIVDCAQQGLYDAILVGRRGLSRVQKAFMGSTTAKLVEHSRVIPVWVVDGDVTSMKVMLAVDGSEASRRAVDHLSFMVGGNKQVQVTLFHVMPMFNNDCVVNLDEKEYDVGRIIDKGAKRCIDNIYTYSRQIFREAGIQDNQLELKVKKHSVNVGKAILDYARKQNYGIVVIGRRGINHAFFMGSVSRYMLDKISNRSLWVIS